MDQELKREVRCKLGNITMYVIEELKSLLRKVKEESENVDLKLKDTKIMAAKHKDHGSKSHHFMTNRRGKGGSSDRFPILGL